MLSLTEEKESSFNLKLFLHVVYEIDSSIHYLKDILFSQKEQIAEIINRDVNKERRKFEKIYYDFDMKLPFENLLTWFEERT
jgi:transcriptional regulatory protein LevR